MDVPEDKPPFAWQPLTPRGVAAFARASLGRLLGIQFVFALLAAGTVVWFLHRDWFPVISEAISQMPDQGEIRSGKLDWPGESPALLGENRFLAFAVDLEHAGGARSPAHVQVEFGRADYQVISLFGFARGAYPTGWVFGFNHAELTPWWGAWAPPILGLAALAVMFILMVNWALLATLFFWLAWLVGFYADRELSWRGSWRLAGASLMPGALLLTAAIVGYGLGTVDLLLLTIAWGSHLVVGWIYLVVSPFHLPRHSAAVPKINPFTPASESAKPLSETPPASKP